MLSAQTCKNLPADILSGIYSEIVYRFYRGGRFATMDGTAHEVERWDLIIAHPPCTYLSNAATRSHSLKRTPLEKINARTMQRIDAMRLFMAFVNAPCDRIAIENPVGIMNTAYRKPDQVIEPYMFADDEADAENYVTKATCLWLKGLPLLTHKADADAAKGQSTLFGGCIERPNNIETYGRTPSGKVKCWCDTSVRNPKVRSKTFTGIAKAFAEQWG